jgi:hypothetical protein
MELSRVLKGALLSEIKWVGKAVKLESDVGKADKTKSYYFFSLPFRAGS